MDKPPSLNTSLNVKYASGDTKIKLQHRIGLVYLPGALPCFEDFGNLPTDLIKEDALVDGKPASQVLDMIIIPGGSLVESQSINEKVTSEIIKMANSGKFVLGICSGFQVLAKETDVGRLSTIPITRQGLGLLDAEFKPLICTDRVSATVVDESFITHEVGKEVSGFHCHTYGKILLHKDAKPIIVSHVERINYKKAPQDLISGVANKQGNVVGIFVHGLLDQNPTILQSITISLNISPVELEEIRKENANLIKQIKCEIGISTGVLQQKTISKEPSLLMVTATGSGSGKTFIVTGIAGALKKKGYKIGVIKVAGDVRDTVPSLYLIKEPMKPYSSIEIGESGWMPIKQAVEQASKDYNLLIVEGAMNAFTGLLNDMWERPMSTVEVAAALDASTVLVVSCDKEGLEGAMINTLNHVHVLKRLGVKTTGVILNKLWISYLTPEIRQVMKQAFANAGIELVGMVPRLDLEKRGMIPEVEICYEDFGAQAIEAAEKYIDLDLLVKLSLPPTVVPVDYKALTDKFKKVLTDYNFDH